LPSADVCPLEPTPSADPSAIPEPSVEPSLAPADPLVADDPDPSPAPTCPPVVSPSPTPSPQPSPDPDANPSVRTNQDDYAPGSLVIVLGEGWQSGEPVALVVNDDEGQSWRYAETITAGPDGTFRTELRLPAWFVATYTVRATGDVSGTAHSRFNDSIGTGPSTTAHNGSPAATEITIATPSLVAGRLLVASIVVEGLSGSDTICTPAGWTAMTATTGTGGIRLHTFYRAATGGEAASYTWRLRSSAARCSSATLGLVSRGAVGGIVSYAGVDTTSGSGPIVSVTGATASGATASAPSVAGVAANSIVVRSFGNATAASISTASASSTGVANTQVYALTRQGGGALLPSAAVADADQVAAGASGTLTASNGGTGGNWAAQTIVLRMKATTPMLSLTIADGTAQLGSNLTPSGGASNSTDAVAVNLDGAGAGACYVWAGSVTVVSSERYNVTARAAASNTRLDLLTANPATYAACTAGEALGTAMFPAATPAGSWVVDQTSTIGRAHPFWLGLDVRWTDAPSATLGSASLTIEAVVNW
jgi:hypothetical protein